MKKTLSTTSLGVVLLLGLLSSPATGQVRDEYGTTSQVRDEYGEIRQTVARISFLSGAVSFSRGDG